MAHVNGRSRSCTERASTKNPRFPNEPTERAAQLLLIFPGAAQILRAGRK
jgi:hypothetical protein